MNLLSIDPIEPFDGFINYFRNRTNVFSFFSAEGEKLSAYGEPSTVINYSITCTYIKCQWASPENFENTYIVFSFKCPIYLTHYTLKTRTDNQYNLPVSWTVECSNDGQSWFLVDTKEGRDELTKKSAYHTYKCDRSIMFAKKIRIWCKKTTGYRYFHLSKAEFFGKMNISTCRAPFNENQIFTYNSSVSISLQVIRLLILLLVS